MDCELLNDIYIEKSLRKKHDIYAMYKINPIMSRYLTKKVAKDLIKLVIRNFHDVDFRFNFLNHIFN